MGKKGASIVFEQVVLFMIGVVIFIVCFSLFRSYEGYFSESIIENQLDEVGEWIVSSIITFSNDPGVNSTIKVRVPDSMGNEPYLINLTQQGLNLTTHLTSRNVFIPLSGINQRFALSGGFTTIHGGEFVIYKRGDQIFIG
jgi:hypothetical protein